jgi:hypothetical protein
MTGGKTTPDKNAIENAETWLREADVSAERVLKNL